MKLRLQSVLLLAWASGIMAHPAPPSTSDQSLGSRQVNQCGPLCTRCTFLCLQGDGLCATNCEADFGREFCDDARRSNGGEDFCPQSRNPAACTGCRMCFGTCGRGREECVRECASLD
ncbi:hypothetical protein PG999_004076 [Apiospora kogelbergensis]|uniref:Uncharacterized protein n=1 Tax=Apiospora kogelbergensis TaxID=1337665 RepID=A0AAW0R590_9PEZI